MTTWFPPSPAALARLAFWRRPSPAASPDTDAPDAVAVPASAPGWLARLKSLLPARRRASPAAPTTTAQAVDERPGADAATPSLIEPEAAHESEAPAAAASPSLFARLAARLRRQPAPAEDAEQAAMEEVAPDTIAAAEDAADADGATSPRGLRKLLAILSRKRVWIPAAGVALLTVFGGLGAMLWQSSQQNAALQAKLQEAEKQLDRASPAAGMPKPLPATSSRPAGPLVANAQTAGPDSAMSGADCDISNAESVAQRLKACIDAFNQETALAQPARR